MTTQHFLTEIGICHLTDQSVRFYNCVYLAIIREQQTCNIIWSPYMQHARKIGKDRACGSGDMLADRQTDRHADVLITILRHRFRG